MTQQESSGKIERALMIIFVAFLVLFVILYSLDVGIHSGRVVALRSDTFLRWIALSARRMQEGFETRPEDYRRIKKDITKTRDPRGGESSLLSSLCIIPHIQYYRRAWPSPKRSTQGTTSNAPHEPVKACAKCSSTPRVQRCSSEARSPKDQNVSFSKFKYFSFLYYQTKRTYRPVSVFVRYVQIIQMSLLPRYRYILIYDCLYTHPHHLVDSCSYACRVISRRVVIALPVMSSL